MDKEHQNDSKEISPRSEKRQWVEAEKLVQIGVMLPLALVAGYFIGSLLDHKLHTTWIKVVGLLVGIAAGFVQLVRVASSAGKK